MEARQQTNDNQTPIRSRAKAILKKLDACIADIHEKFTIAFAGADENKAQQTTILKIYNQIWPTLRLYIDNIETGSKIEDLDAPFNKFIGRMPDFYTGFKDLDTSEQKLLLSLVSYYKALTKLRFMLLQLISMGFNLREIEHASTIPSVDAQLKMNALNREEQSLRTRLTTEIKYIIENTDMIAAVNPIVQSYKKKLEKQLTTADDQQSEKKGVFAQQFKTMQDELNAFSQKITQYKLKVEAAVSAFSKNNQLNVIRQKAKQVEERLKKINSQNVLNIADQLEKQDGIAQEITSLIQELADCRREYKASEARLNDEAKSLLDEMQVLRKKFLLFKETKEGGKLAEIDQYLQYLKMLSASADLREPPEDQPLKDIPENKRVMQLYAQFTDHLCSLNHSESRLLAEKKKLEEIHDTLNMTRALGLMLSAKGNEEKPSPFVTILSEQNIAKERTLKGCEKQYTDFLINRLFGNQEKHIEIWKATVAVINDSFELISGEIKRLHASITFTTMNAEITEIKRSIKAEADLIGSFAENIKLKYKSLQPVEDSYIASQRDLQNCLHQNLKLIFDNACQEFNKQKLDAVSRLAQLRSAISAYRPGEIKLSTDPVKLFDVNDAAALEKKLGGLNILYKDKIVLLLEAKQKKARDERRKEVEEVVSNTRKIAGQQSAEDIRPKQEPGFFRKYWAVITAATVGMGVCFAAGGLMAGIFGAPITFGLSIPVVTGIAFAIGAVVGCVTAIAGCAIKQCAGRDEQAKTDRIETEMATVTGKPIDPGNTHSIKSQLGCVQQQDDAKVEATRTPATAPLLPKHHAANSSVRNFLLCKPGRIAENCHRRLASTRALISMHRRRGLC